MLPYKKIFWAVFAYSILVAGVLQLVILPHLLPQFHAGYGLLKSHDWVTFHNNAVDLVQTIRQSGWQAWSLRPFNLVEVGLITPVYYWIPRPWALIPINAFIHALSCLILLMLVRGFTDLKGKKAYWAVLPFAILPTSLLWVTQIHKDGIVILSCFLFLLTMKNSAELRSHPAPKLKNHLILALQLSVGIFLGWLVRPYLMDVFVFLSLLVAASLFLALVIARQTKRFAIPVVLVVVPLFLSSFLKGVSLSPPPPREMKIQGVITVREKPQEKPQVPKADNKLSPPSKQPQDFFPSEIHQDLVKVSIEKPKEAVWTPTPFLPYSLDQRLYTLSQIRLGYSRTPAPSNYDTDKQFLSAWQLLKHLPRALEVAFLAPFPSFFSNHIKQGEMGFFREFVKIEMYLIYLLLPLAAIQFFRNRRNLSFWIVFLCASSFMAAYSITIVNLGTLHRFRYGFINLFLAVGIPLLFEVKTLLSFFRSRSFVSETV